MTAATVVTPERLDLATVIPGRPDLAVLTPLLVATTAKMMATAHRRQRQDDGDDVTTMTGGYGGARGRFFF
uniref:Uncharacterized protein n=1 Tax=Leersia perrieri TaxID=77586 RepID=A0A0D9XTP1_9ORYZ